MLYCDFADPNAENGIELDQRNLKRKCMFKFNFAVHIKKNPLLYHV